MPSLKPIQADLTYLEFTKKRIGLIFVISLASLIGLSSERSAAQESSNLNISNLSGAWHWTARNNTKLQIPHSSHGLFVLQDKAGLVQGKSMLELALVPNKNRRRSMLSVFTIEGRRTLNQEGQITFTFEAKGNGSYTESTAYLSKDGRTLNGRSTSTFRNSKISDRSISVRYAWIATRLKSTKKVG